MGLPDDDRQALHTRLVPGGARAADAIADAIGDGEELRETLTDVQGDVVAFTDQRALFVDHTGSDVQAFPYGEIDVRRRQSGLGVDALVEGGRLVLDVAKGTFIRLAVVPAGAPPGRGTWLPTRTPVPAPAPAPPPIPDATLVVDSPVGATADAPVDVTRPPRPPVGSMPSVSTFPPVPPLSAEPPQAPQPSAGPAPVPPASQAPPPAPAPVAGAAVPAMPPPGLPPAGWNPDPSGRHWWRWWDGMSWTDHVADGGASFVDPLPPR